MHETQQSTRADNCQMEDNTLTLTRLHYFQCHKILLERNDFVETPALLFTVLHVIEPIFFRFPVLFLYFLVWTKFLFTFFPTFIIFFVICVLSSFIPTSFVFAYFPILKKNMLLRYSPCLCPFLTY